MMRIVLIALTLGGSSVSMASPRSLAALVRGCWRDDVNACRWMADHLERTMAPIGSSKRDRVTGRELAQRAVDLVRTATSQPGQVVDAAIARCGSGDEAECDHLAVVLEELFRGEDARLAGSADRELARGIAARIATAPDAQWAQRR